MDERVQQVLKYENLNVEKQGRGATRETAMGAYT